MFNFFQENDRDSESDQEDNYETNKINEINNYFKLPIYYNSQKVNLRN